MAWGSSCCCRMMAIWEQYSASGSFKLYQSIGCTKMWRMYTFWSRAWRLWMLNQWYPLFCHVLGPGNPSRLSQVSASSLSRQNSGNRARTSGGAQLEGSPPPAPAAGPWSLTHTGELRNFMEATQITALSLLGSFKGGNLPPPLPPTSAGAGS